MSDYVEELDYNEDMDNLDVHPMGILEEEEEEKDGTLYNSVYTCIVLNIVIDLTVHGINR